MPRSCVFLAALGLFACSSPSIRGADVAPAGREPRGRVVASYRASECKDSRGAPFAHASRVTLLELKASGRVLVESNPGRDSLVVHNRFTDGTEVVYQTVLDDGDGKRVMHDYRLPADAHGNGWMALATSFSQNEDEAAPLHGKVVAAAVSCRLVADEAEPAADAGSTEP